MTTVCGSSAVSGNAMVWLSCCCAAGSHCGLPTWLSLPLGGTTRSRFGSWLRRRGNVRWTESKLGADSAVCVEQLSGFSRYFDHDGVLVERGGHGALRFGSAILQVAARDE